MGKVPVNRIKVKEGVAIKFILIRKAGVAAHGGM